MSARPHQVSAKSPPKVRALAWDILRQVLGRKAFAAECLDQALVKYTLITEDARLLTQIIYGTLRELAWLDSCLKKHLDFSKTPLASLCLLRLSAYQMLCLEKVPDYAVLSESVDLAKKKLSLGAGKLVNGVLRSLQKEKTQLIQEKNDFLKKLNKNINNNVKIIKNYKEISKVISLPAWLLKRWASHYGAPRALSLALSFNQVPSLYLRCNLAKTTLEACEAELQNLGFEYDKTTSQNILKLKSLNWQGLQPLLKKGCVSIQDLGSYQLVEKLNLQAGEHGLDACAGKGIKASALAEELSMSSPIGELSVHEPVLKRLSKLKANFERLGLTNYQILSDKKSAPDKGFDFLLVDAPCTGLATLGRKPEIRWKATEKSLVKHTIVQLSILSEWAPLVRLGGRLLYAVCSLEPEEGSQVIEKFLKQNAAWCVRDQGEIWPGQNAGADGFYWAELHKAS